MDYEMPPIALVIAAGFVLWSISPLWLKDWLAGRE